jgi:hypothetical protein
MMFISKTSNTLNGKPLRTTEIATNICVSVNYPSINVNKNNKILIDSGAYQEQHFRKSFSFAYQRQKEILNKINANAYYLASYDRIGDYQETIKANNFIIENCDKNIIPIIIIQGNNIDEMEKCYNEIGILDREICLGIGGINKAGRDYRVRNRLYKFLDRNLNNIQSKSINRIHLFGIGSIPIIHDIYNKYNNNEIKYSFDTAGIEIKSVMGYIFEDGKWFKRYSKNDKFVNYHPNDLYHANLLKYMDCYNKIEQRRN